MKLQTISHSQIKFDKSIYPRQNAFNLLTVIQYSDAMKAGAKFPPICVGKYANELYLIDGKNRLESYKRRKVFESTVEIVDFKNKNDMLIEAIKRNNKHGLSFNPYDKTNLILRLEKANISETQISELLNMSVHTINHFKATRITNSITGEEIALKATTKHFAGKEMSQMQETGNQLVGGINQEQTLNNLIELLENNLINLKNPRIVEQLKTIRNLIQTKILAKYKH